jgi:hypothetical protein
MIEPEFSFSRDHPVKDKWRGLCYVVMTGSDIRSSGCPDDEAQDMLPVPGNEIKDSIFATAPVNQVSP